VHARNVSTLGTRFRARRSEATLALENWRKQAARERLKLYAEQNKARFDEWRRQHTVALIVAGGKISHKLGLITTSSFYAPL
jgi:hypothetical protein